jgi:hypothetical protein
MEFVSWLSLSVETSVIEGWMLISAIISEFSHLLDCRILWHLLFSFCTSAGGPSFSSNYGFNL